jgi:hypothetical protein
MPEKPEPCIKNQFASVMIAFGIDELKLHFGVEV